MTKGVTASSDRLRSGERDLYSRHEAIELEGKTLGLVGFGRIARRVATVGPVAGHEGQWPSIPFSARDAVAVRESTTSTELLRGADVVSVHVPLTGETRGLFDQRRFEAMKPGAFFINTSRGGVVDQEALVWRRSPAGICEGQVSTSPIRSPCRPIIPLLHRSDVDRDPPCGLGHFRGEAQDLPFGSGCRCWPSWTGSSRSTW